MTLDAVLLSFSKELSEKDYSALLPHEKMDFVFMFIPIDMIQELFRSLINSFVVLSETAIGLFDTFFLLVSTVVAILAFIYLFNKRFDDMEAFKNQVKNKDSKKKSTKEDDDFELPKAKETK